MTRTMPRRASTFRLLLTFLLFLTACASGAETATAPPPTNPIPVAWTSTPETTPQPALATSALPKARDLLFIEFFAVT